MNLFPLPVPENTTLAAQLIPAIIGLLFCWLMSAYYMQTGKEDNNRFKAILGAVLVPAGVIIFFLGVYVLHLALFLALGSLIWMIGRGLVNLGRLLVETIKL